MKSWERSILETIPKPVRRRVFFSFHHKQDAWRTAQIRNAGTLDGNKPISDNDWEKVKRRGDVAIKQWIDDQIRPRSCTVVLIGSQTAGRKWIEYEIKKSWNDRKGLLGIYIHKLLDKNGRPSAQGPNPFDNIPVPTSRGLIPLYYLSSFVTIYDPRPTSNHLALSKAVYNHINDNIADWVENAIQKRNQYP